ncbi:MAG: gamma-glutamylcyclotransferase [Leptolyngbyaceae cyanobacterium]
METIDVFVYGTLKPGGRYHQHYCAAYLQTSQLAQVRGLLYDLPDWGYPVMTPGDSWVKGYLFSLEKTALSGLDDLEGYSPLDSSPQPTCPDAEDAYRRIQVPIYDLTGRFLQDAWVYMMDMAPDGAVLLLGGEWLD